MRTKKQLAKYLAEHGWDVRMNRHNIGSYGRSLPSGVRTSLGHDRYSQSFLARKGDLYINYNENYNASYVIKSVLSSLNGNGGGFSRLSRVTKEAREHFLESFEQADGREIYK